jgi:hypothetical protein
LFLVLAPKGLLRADGDYQPLVCLPPPQYVIDSANWATYGYGICQDVGDGYVTFRDSPYPTYKLQLTRANVDDTGMQVLLKGNDAAGDPIFTPNSTGDTSYEGMTVTLDNATVTTTQIFSGRLGFFQKLRTRGYVYLDAVDVATADITRIGYYSPSETSPSYHRYFVGCVDSENPVIAAALCKLRYTPAVADSDEIIPSNYGALRAGLAALKCEKEGDAQRRDLYFNDGLKIATGAESRGTRMCLKIERLSVFTACCHRDDCG